MENSKIVIPFNDKLNIIAEENNYDGNHPEIVVAFQEKETGLVIQDLVLVRKTEDEAELLLWEDENNEDYTSYVKVPVHNFENDEAEINKNRLKDYFAAHSTALCEELKKYSFEQIADKAYWSDKDTWFQPYLKLSKELDDILRPLFEWDGIENQDLWLEIEYWKNDPDKKIVYIVSTEHDTIPITEFVNTSHINDLVMQIVTLMEE